MIGPRNKKGLGRAMKKSFVFLGLSLLGTYGAYAESLDGFFQDQSAPDLAPSPRGASEPMVIKPQVVYLEDLDPQAKATPPSAGASVPVKTPSAPPAATTPTVNPVASEGRTIKTEPLPKAFAKNSPPVPDAVPLATAPTPTATQDPAVEKSVMRPRKAREEEASYEASESRQTLSSFREQHMGQYAPFATQTSRQQAAHSLVTQAKNEGRTYPAGLDPFVIEFDQTFGVLSPNAAIRDLYKTAPLMPMAVQGEPALTFRKRGTMNAPAPIVSVAPSVTTPPIQDRQSPQYPAPLPVSTPTPSNTLVLEEMPETASGVSPQAPDRSPSPLATVMVPETAQALDAASQNLLDQVAAAYHDGTLNVIHITGYVNTRPAHDEDVRGYTHMQSLGRRGAALVVAYLQQQQVPESAMVYRVIPTSTIALYNPFYASASTENTLRLDIAGGKS